MHICPLCGADDPEPILAVRDVPLICNQLYHDAASAKATPRADIDLVVCPVCTLIWNRSFDPARMTYAPGYENALHFSPHFQHFAETLAADLIDRNGLRDKDIVEIGCGDGHMLDLMVKRGARSAIGFDPSMAGKPSRFVSRPGVSIVPEYFRPDQLDRGFDALICRHVVEHLDAPMAFLEDIRRAIGARETPIYIEVPNADWLVERRSVWDAIYEHVTYWTAGSMETLFRRAGFAPRRIEAGYGRQFLMAEGRASDPDPDFVVPDRERAEALAAARVFAQAARDEIERWQQQLSGWHGRAVVWGAGSKGITFANAMGASAQPLVAMVDLNVRKHGLMVAGVGLPVVAPDDLTTLEPDLVLIANGLYETEIRDRVSNLGLTPDFSVLAG